MTSFETLRWRSRTWAWQALLGTLLIALGVLAIFYPFASSFTLGVYLAWALIASGVFGILTALRTMRMRGHGLDAILGVLSVAAGFVVLVHPFAGALAALWAIGVWLALSGAAKLFTGRQVRHERAALFATGVLDLLLAMLFFLGFAAGDLFLVATLAGVSLMVGGIATIAFAWRLRDVARHLAHRPAHA